MGGGAPGGTLAWGGGEVWIWLLGNVTDPGLLEAGKGSLEAAHFC